MSHMIAFGITLSTGLFFLLGLLISRFAKKKEEIITFSIGLALSVTLGMIFFDLIPECFKIFKEYSLLEQILRIGSMVLLGIILLKVLDLFVPTHTHHHEENENNHEEHMSHLKHIGIVTSLALFIHNILEGAAIFTASLTSVSMGLLMMAGVSLHNIPLGIEIASALEKKQKGFFLLLVLSPFLGAILVFSLPASISSLLEGYLICLSLGMMLYLAIFELFFEFLAHIHKKEGFLGLICGMIIMCIALLL